MKKKKNSDHHRGLCILILIILLGWGIHNLCIAQKIVGPIEKENNIFIFVTGIVTNPGVYTFERNPSLKEVMTKAGYSSHAELREAISRDTHPSFTHGTSVNIRSENGYIYVSTGTMPAAYKITLHIPISLNTASLEDLDTIPGIGPTIGKNIIHYRYLHGPFKTIEEIQHVSGIGKIRYLKIKPYIGI
jgi:competence protein ComEA